MPKSLAKTTPPAKPFQIRPKPTRSTSGPGTRTRSGWLTIDSSKKEENGKRKLWPCANTAGHHPSHTRPAALPAPSPPAVLQAQRRQAERRGQTNGNDWPGRPMDRERSIICTMTTINNQDDFLEALRNNPQWRDAVRAQILGEELMQLPLKFDAFVEEQKAHNQKLDAFVEEQKAINTNSEARFNRIDARFDRMESDLGTIKGDFARDPHPPGRPEHCL